MKVTQSFTFGGKAFESGDEIDLDKLEADDRADLVGRGVFEAPKKAKHDKAAKETPEAEK